MLLTENEQKFVKVYLVNFWQLLQLDRLAASIAYNVDSCTRNCLVNYKVDYREVATFCSYFWKTFPWVFFLWHSVVKAFEIMLLHYEQWLQDFEVGEVLGFFPEQQAHPIIVEDSLHHSEAQSRCHLENHCSFLF